MKITIWSKKYNNKQFIQRKYYISEDGQLAFPQLVPCICKFFITVERV